MDSLLLRVFYSILILEKQSKSSQKWIKNDRLFGKCVSTEVASANTNTNTSIHIIYIINSLLINISINIKIVNSTYIIVLILIIICICITTIPNASQE